MKYCSECGGWGVVAGQPPVEREPRLTIEVRQWAQWPEHSQWRAWVRLDGGGLVHASLHDTEPEARAAAQAYVDELLAHIRAGGR